MIPDSFFDLGPAAFGFAIARSHADFFSQGFKGQRTFLNRGHDGSRLDVSANTNLFYTI
jgi:hypothetical protein